MFIFAMPYIIFYWIIASKYSQFHNFVSSSHYKSSKVALMVNSSKNPNIMLMNEFWYEIITLIVIVLVIELGVIVFAFLQEKISEKKKGVKSIYKYQTPKDVKESYIMPILLFLGIFLIVVSLVLDRSVTNNYQKKVMASAMKYNEELAIYNGDKNSKGTLTLGHTILSKDGKTLAAEIKYDQTAHENLSSFGSRYRLRLVKRRDNKKIINSAMVYLVLMDQACFRFIVIMVLIINQ